MWAALGTLAVGSLLGTRAALWGVAALFLLYGVILFASPLRSMRDLPAAAKPRTGPG